MRPVETLLSIANLLTFFALAISLARSMLWIRYLAPIVLLIAIVQVLVEGSRWQMFPAYAMAGLFFLAWLLQNNVPIDAPVRHILNSRAAACLSVGVSLLGLIVSITLPIVLPVFRFPHPGGPYEIGTLTYHWVDTSRPEIFSADPNARRELMVQIWYPARKKSPAVFTPYLQDSDAVTTALARPHNFPDFSLKHLKYVTTNAISSVPVAQDQPSYPVLILL